LSQSDFHGVITRGKFVSATDPHGQIAGRLGQLSIVVPFGQNKNNPDATIYLPGTVFNIRLTMSCHPRRSTFSVRPVGRTRRPSQSA
jgi:hypothetical protein